MNLYGNCAFIRKPNGELINIPVSYKINQYNRTKISNIWNSYDFKSFDEIEIGSYVTFKDYFLSDSINSSCKMKIESIEEWIFPENYNHCKEYKLSEHSNIIFKLGLNESSQFSIEENMKYSTSKLNYTTNLMIELSYENIRGKKYYFKRFISKNGPFEFVDYKYLEEIIEKIDILEGRETRKEVYKKTQRLINN